MVIQVCIDLKVKKKETQKQQRKNIQHHLTQHLLYISHTRIRRHTSHNKLICCMHIRLKVCTRIRNAIFIPKTIGTKGM